MSLVSLKNSGGFAIRKSRSREMRDNQNDSVEISAEKNVKIFDLVDDDVVENTTLRAGNTLSLPNQ